MNGPSQITLEELGRLADNAWAEGSPLRSVEKTPDWVHDLARRAAELGVREVEDQAIRVAGDASRKSLERAIDVMETARSATVGRSPDKTTQEGIDVLVRLFLDGAAALRQSIARNDVGPLVKERIVALAKGLTEKRGKMKEKISDLQIQQRNNLVLSLEEADVARWNVNVATATGAELDAIGHRLGLPREAIAELAETDAEYRDRLESKNGGGGTGVIQIINRKVELKPEG